MTAALQNYQNLKNPFLLLMGLPPFAFTPCIIESKCTCLRCFTN